MQRVVDDRGPLVTRKAVRNKGATAPQERNQGGTVMCHHQPRCPGAQDSDRLAAHPVASHTEQGWSLLCNGIIVFDDNGALLPDGTSLACGTAPSSHRKHAA
jgi:hypothetical protein